MTGFVDLAAVAGYGALLLLVGSALSRQQETAAAFFLADRRLKPIAVFGTTFSTFLGTGIVFVFGSFGYRYGVGAFFLPAAAVVGFLLLAWAAPHIKAQSDAEAAITLPALMRPSRRDRTRLLAALITAGLFTGTLAASLLVVGELLNVVVGLSPSITIPALSALVVAYSVLGGFRAVVWTDFFQFGLIAVTFLALLPFLAVRAAGDVGLGSLPADLLDPFGVPVPLLASYLLIGVFAFFGSQDLLQRIFAARDPAAARHGLLACTGLLAVMGIASVGLGILARMLLPGAPPDRALLVLADAMTPADLVGLVGLGFLALANSDADSQLLTVASTVSQDLAPLLGLSPARHRWVTVDRLAVGGVGGVAAVVAMLAPSLAALFGALGAWFVILGVVVVLSLGWDRTSDAAAFWGLAVGVLSSAASVAATGAFQAAPVVGLLATVGVVVVVTLRTGRRTPG